VALFHHPGSFSYRDVSAILNDQITLSFRSGGLGSLGDLGTKGRKSVVQRREPRSLFGFIAPAGRDHIPNVVVQPLIPSWVRGTGWSFAKSNIGDHTAHITVFEWHYPRKDLIVTGLFYQAVG
jgi:hypothetical protein